MPETNRLPSWFKQEIPALEKIRGMKKLFRETGLHTVCESAHCPNIGECWGRKTATFMILGDVCTRACRFCAVAAGKPLVVDPHEPTHVANAVQKLNLKFVVITSVARDDLPDGGATQFAKTIFEIRHLLPEVKIEILIPDFSGKFENLKIVIDAKPEVISHNIETVARLSKKVRPQAEYRRSLETLKMMRELDPSIIVKSSLMVGLGERRDEVEATMKDLLKAGCDILTVGQYLAPSQLKRHVPVERFVTPEEFESYKATGLSLGFRYVASGPLVRSSYLAEEGYRECLAIV